MWASPGCCTVQTEASLCLSLDLKKNRWWWHQGAKLVGLTNTASTIMAVQLSWLQTPAEQASICPRYALSTSAHQASDKILKVLDVFLGCSDPLLLFTLVGTEQHLSITHSLCCIMEVQDVRVQYFSTQWVIHYSVAQWDTNGFDFLGRIRSISELAHAASVGMADVVLMWIPVGFCS